MIIKQKDEEGNEVEVEVFSSDEVNNKIAEKEEEFKKTLAEKDSTLTILEQEKKELEDKVGQTKPDHPNFASLKEALKTKDAEFNKLKEEVINEKKIRQQEMMENKIKNISKGNNEVEKKIKLHLTSTLSGMPETNEVEREAKLNAALKLSVDYGGGDPNILDSIMNGAGAPGIGNDKCSSGNSVEFSAREKALGAKFGITEEDYKKLFDKQKGCCAICGVDYTASTRNLDVDHCHDTNIVRGLLCNNCNRGLGHFQDDPEILQKAVLYLDITGKGGSCGV